jgi:transcriptional regulator with XRE-family HTH domain
MTQKDVAAQLGWSVSKVVRMEQGVNPIAPSDIRALLSLFGEADKTVIDNMADLARRAREARGYDKFAQVLKPSTRELMGLEPSARSIYKYEPSVVPGLFQSPDYARALLRAIEHSADEIETLIEIRIRRQEMLEHPAHPELHFVLGEAAIARAIGGPQLMNEQLDHLLELAKVPRIEMHLVPFSAGGHRGMGSAFTIMQFADASLPDLLYLENAERESTSRDDEHEIRKYIQIYNEIEALAIEAGSFADQVAAIRRQRFVDT